MTHKTYVRFSNVYHDTTVSFEAASISNESVNQVIELLTIPFLILINVYANKQFFCYADILLSVEHERQ